MKNSKLVEEAKLAPGRIYQRPHDVLRDRRLDDAGRLEVLTGWERTLRSAANHNGSRENELLELEKARREVEERSVAPHDVGS
jgi:hypothetical protein